MIEKDPQYVPAYFQKAQALGQAGQNEEAKQVLSKGINVAHTTGDTHAEAEMKSFLESL